ncbi:HTH_Tnp_Tc3_2 domain-containing protein [Trichonephila clavipes]|nr:HTH_Tnp_Tc3_2 domain-containing protein [Trichonephila clavipes]
MNFVDLDLMLLSIRCRADSSSFDAPDKNVKRSPLSPKKADTRRRISERNARCDNTSGWGKANREVTHSVPPTNHSACFPHPVHSNLPWFPPQTLTSSPPPTPLHTSSTTFLQPANQKLLEAVDTREGTHARKTESGANRKTTRREERRIVRQALVDPTVTRSTIRADVGVAIVPQTIFKHLAEVNLKSKRPFRALSLTPEHRQQRLQWCQARSMWNITDWQKVVFSDEFRFVLGTDDNRVRVWRHPGERYNSPRTVLRHTARTAGVMTLPWPARSPDLSPVEHVWDQLKWQMPSCHSVHDLELAVQNLWAHMPQDNIRCLINSMPDRVAACITTGGGPTRY